MRSKVGEREPSFVSVESGRGVWVVSSETHPFPEVHNTSESTEFSDLVTDCVTPVYHF